MISDSLRKRLENFLDTHLCEGDRCSLTKVHDWVSKMQKENFPEHELMLMGLACEAYEAHSLENDMLVRTYQAALAAVVAKHGGILKISMDDVDELKNGTMTSFRDPIDETITYRLIPESHVRS